MRALIHLLKTTLDKVLQNMLHIFKVEAYTIKLLKRKIYGARSSARMKSISVCRPVIQERCSGGSGQSKLLRCNLARCQSRTLQLMLRWRKKKRGSWSRIKRTRPTKVKSQSGLETSFRMASMTKWSWLASRTMKGQGKQAIVKDQTLVQVSIYQKF